MSCDPPITKHLYSIEHISKIYLYECLCQKSNICYYIGSIFSALSSENEDLIEGAAILLGSAAQSNVQVQDSAEKAGLLKTLLDLFETW